MKGRVLPFAYEEQDTLLELWRLNDHDKQLNINIYYTLGRLMLHVFAQQSYIISIKASFVVYEGVLLCIGLIWHLREFQVAVF